VAVSWGNEGSTMVVATIVSTTSGTISETASRAEVPSPVATSGTTAVAGPDVLDDGDVLEDGVLCKKKQRKREV
jgi:hypothetical protein